MEIVNIPLDAIELGERLREVDADHAAVIAESFSATGQMTPIEVQELADAGRFLLISGAHRVTAARTLGWESIAAVVFGGEDAEAKLREIDENLCRHELSALDRATFLAERKRFYDAAFPETTRGKWDRKAKRDKISPFARLTFTKEVAQRIGVSDRDVKRSLFRFRAIAPDVRTRISGTALADKGVELDALARLDAEQQRAVVELILAGEPRARNVTEALRRIGVIAGHVVDVDEKQFVSLMGAWRRAGTVARGRFVAVLVAEGAVAPAEGGKSSNRRVA